MIREWTFHSFYIDMQLSKVVKIDAKTKKETHTVHIFAASRWMLYFMWTCTSPVAKCTFDGHVCSRIAHAVHAFKIANVIALRFIYDTIRYMYRWMVWYSHYMRIILRLENNNNNEKKRRELSKSDWTVEVRLIYVTFDKKSTYILHNLSSSSSFVLLLWHSKLG